MEINDLRGFVNRAWVSAKAGRQFRTMHSPLPVDPLHPQIFKERARERRTFFTLARLIGIASVGMQAFHTLPHFCR
jgi:hypothetical protein